VCPNYGAVVTTNLATDELLRLLSGSNAAPVIQEVVSSSPCLKMQFPIPFALAITATDANGDPSLACSEHTCLWRRPAWCWAQRIPRMFL